CSPRSSPAIASAAENNVRDTAYADESGRAPGRSQARPRSPRGVPLRRSRKVGGPMSGDRVEHLALDLQLHPVLLQRAAVDQEGVLDALAEGRDLGQLQVDLVAGEDA